MGGSCATFYGGGEKGYIDYPSINDEPKGE